MALSLYPNFTGDPIEQAYKYVDTVLAHAPENGQFRLEDVIKNSDLPQLAKDIARHILGSLRTVIRDYLKYAEPIQPNWIPLRLTDEGKAAKKAGGHEAYLRLKEQRESQQLCVTNNHYGENFGAVFQTGHQSSFSSFELTNKPTIQPNNADTTQSDATLKKGVVMRILTNPWVITITGGLIIAFLAKHFGWV